MTPAATMNPDPAEAERCSPLDLSSAVLLPRLLDLIPTTIAATDANPAYSPVTKAALAYEMRALGNNLRNVVSLSALESQIP